MASPQDIAAQAAQVVQTGKAPSGACPTCGQPQQDQTQDVSAAGITPEQFAALQKLMMQKDAQGESYRK